MVILPTPLPAPHVSGLLLELNSGVRSRNCIFISLTSGSIFGFSSPAAAVARLTSEQLNLGQPLLSLALVAEPRSGGEVSVMDGFFFFFFLVVGRGERVLTHWLLAPLPVRGGVSLFEAQSSLGAPDICISRQFWNSHDFYNDEIDWDSTSLLTAKSQ